MGCQNFFSPMEDERLLALCGSGSGMTWRTMTRRHFPTRSAASIRNRKYRIERTYPQKAIQRCRYCGEMRRGHTCRVRATEVAPGDAPTDGCLYTLPKEFRLVVPKKKDSRHDERGVLSGRTAVLDEVARRRANEFGFEFGRASHVSSFPFDTSTPRTP